MSSSNVVFRIIGFSNFVYNFSSFQGLYKGFIATYLYLRRVGRVDNVNMTKYVLFVGLLRRVAAISCEYMIVVVLVTNGRRASRIDLIVTVYLTRAISDLRAYYKVTTTGVDYRNVNYVVVTSYSRKMRVKICEVPTMLSNCLVVVLMSDSRSVRLSRTYDLRFLVVGATLNSVCGVKCRGDPNSIFDKGLALGLFWGYLRFLVYSQF